MMGGVYAIIAVGLSLIFGVMRVTNFAHGEFLMIAMYISYGIILCTGLDPYITVILCGLILFGGGFIFQKLFINKLLQREKSREPMSILLFTAGFGMFASNLALMLFGANPIAVSTKYSGKTFNLGNLIISTPRFYAFVVATMCTLILYWFLYRTETGRALRATSQNRMVAKLMGIDEQLIYCIAFAIGIGLVGIAGALLVPFYYIFPSLGAVFGNRSFIIVVLGGMGSVPGALLGGLIVGVIEAVGGVLLSPSYAEILVFLIFIFILLFKPSGLLSTERE